MVTLYVGSSGGGRPNVGLGNAAALHAKTNLVVGCLAEASEDAYYVVYYGLVKV